ncbi:MAG: hypothetical protein IJQ36_06270 [Oscillospiraceae bacterium]|nr:hypothetical protein [Oscillospiraceae bacterium]
MWENNRKKGIITNVLLVFLILLIAGVLIMAMLRVHQMNAAQDEELSAIHIQQQQEQSAARSESLTAIQDEYDKDMRTVAAYTPGIVCWGDDITAGSFAYLNYPYVLQTYINAYLCDIYDFRSTIANAEEFSRLKWDDYTFSIPVVNMGAGKESSYTILGRCGAVPYIVSEEFVVPAGVEPVPIQLKSMSGNPVTPLIGGSAGINNVVINGIEGVLSIDSEAYNYNSTYNYFFTRVAPGAETTIPAESVIQTAASNLYKDYIHVVFIGTYGNYNNADDLVQQVKTLLARQTQNTERFIVLGPYSVDGWTASTYQLDAIDTAMLQAFGNRYINIRKYLLGDGYTDAGIKPTSEDDYSISANAVPPSFLVTAHSTELNSTAHKLIGKLIFSRMESLGYFDEVKDELRLNDTTKQILKDDPAYFETIIKNTLK